MSKTKIKNLRRGVLDRGEIYAHYVAKYFNLFLNRFTWSGDIRPEEVAFVMRQLWSVGTVACFKLQGSEGSAEFPSGKPVFTPYAVNQWNLYHYPVTVSLIQLQGATFVPTRPLKVDEEAVIGFAQRNKEPVVRIVDYYARKLASAEMVLQTNLNAQKYPWLIGTSPEGADKSRALAEMLLEDNPTLFVELEEIDKAKALISGAPYIIDKLFNYIQNLENGLREYLGFPNLGVGEKKEHLLTDEIAANDVVTASSGDTFLDCLQEFTDRIAEHLGPNIGVELNQSVIATPAKQGDAKQEDDDQGGEYDA